MKVSELIEKLSKCSPDATVEFAYEEDHVIVGDSISGVAYFVLFDDDKEDDIKVVQLRV